jgi:hypothetical protein
MDTVAKNGSIFTKETVNVDSLMPLFPVALFTFRALHPDTRCPLTVPEIVMIPSAVQCIRFGRIFALIAFFLCACQYAGAKELRGDVIIMKNGDRFTGEVKGLQSGVLYVDTTYVSANIALDWAQVKEVQSKAMYLITLASGVHVTGRIERTAADQVRPEDVTIHNEDHDVHVPSADIVELSIQKSSIWRQLKGSLDAGVGFTSGNSQVNVTTNAVASYSTPNWAAAASLGTSFDGQAAGTKTNRNDLSLGGQRFLSRNSYLGGLVDFLHSSQQDLDLRTTAGGGYGRYLKRSGTTEFRWLAGVVYTKESFTTVTSPSDSNAEALLGVDYDSFRFKVGEIHMQVMMFPGLSDYGRIRTTTNNSLVIKLTNNFHFNLTFWDNYDSRPPATAKNNELGLSSGIGWSF